MSDEMRLAHGRHLAYGSGVPTDPGWRERVRAVRNGVCRPGEELGLGLRLDEEGTRELLSSTARVEFRRWMAAERCYVFTVDGLLAGWTRPESLAHACRLLDGLGELLPEGVDGSVGIVLAEERRTEAELQAIYANLIHAAVHAAEVTGCTGRRVRLALAAETVRFLEPLVDAFPDQFGACFDADRDEEPGEVLAALDHAEIPVLKMRLGDPSRMTRAIEWLTADAAEGLHLEVTSPPSRAPQEFRRTLDLLAERGLT